MSPMTHPPVLLNMDVGELEEEPEAYYSLVELVHVACGGHAGDSSTMERAVRRAAVHPTRLGAHPSYPDPANFGRKSMPLPKDALTDSLRAQLNALRDVARAANQTVVSVKAHGALYHDTARSSELAECFLDAVESSLGFALAIVGPPDSVLVECARTRGFEFWTEGFADRGLQPDGSLIPRSEPGALISDPERCAAQAVHLAQTGRYQTLCLHGDRSGSVERARAVRRALDELRLKSTSGSERVK
jgi:5-oxoprolinase (ATP-hydrolysing) subunit A